MVTRMNSHALDHREKHEPRWVSAIDGITRVGAAIVGLATLILLLVIVSNVVMRNALSIPLPGSLSLIAYWCMPAIGIMGLGFVHLRNEQIVMTLLAENASERVIKRLSIAVEVVIAGLLVVLIVSTWAAAMEDFTLRRVDQTERWLPIWPGRFVLFTGLVIVLLAIPARIYRILTGAVDPVPDEINEAFE